MLYRTASGLSSLSIENAHIQIDNIFEMYAGLNFVEENSGMLLRAAATGSFNIGGSSVAATVAGKFSAIGNDVDRKSTRLNSSHVAISYAVFCLKKKK